jgi:hypothetical protein
MDIVFHDVEDVLVIQEDRIATYGGSGGVPRQLGTAAVAFVVGAALGMGMIGGGKTRGQIWEDKWLNLVFGVSFLPRTTS